LTVGANVAICTKTIETKEVLEMRQPVKSTKPTTRSKAEEQYAATQKKDDRDLKDRQKIQQDAANKVARLRALRLAREAGEEITVNETDIED
jgi:esterase/lipase